MNIDAFMKTIDSYYEYGYLAGWVSLPGSGIHGMILFDECVRAEAVDNSDIEFVLEEYT